VRERLALSVMNLIAQRFITGERAPSQPEFTRLLGVPTHVLNTVLEALEGRGLLLQSADDPPLYLPACDPALISVAQVLDAIRSAGEARFVSPAALQVPLPVDRVLERMQSAVESAVGGISLRALASEGSAGTPSDPVEPVVRAESSL
jgi:membrane protein